MKIDSSYSQYAYDIPVKTGGIWNKVSAVFCTWLLLSSKFGSAQVMYAANPNIYLNESHIISHSKKIDPFFLPVISNYYQPTDESEFSSLIQELHKQRIHPSLLADFVSPHFHSIFPDAFPLLESYIPDLLFWETLFERGLDPSFLNIPNSRGETLLHKAIVSQEILRIQKPLAYLDTKDLVLGRFSEREIDACRNSSESHEKLITEALQDPNSLVVQNDCYAIILKNSGGSMIFPGIDVGALARQIDREWSLSVVYSSGWHGSIALSTGHYGFYPVWTAEHVDDKDDMDLEPCSIQDDSGAPALSKKKAGLKLTLYTTKKQVLEMEEHVRLARQQCKAGERKYSLFDNNCIDFVKETIQTTGLNVDIGDAILTSQVFRRLTLPNLYFLYGSTGPVNIPILSSDESYHWIDRLSRKTTVGIVLAPLFGRAVVKGAVAGTHQSIAITKYALDWIISLAVEIAADFYLPDN